MRVNIRVSRLGGGLYKAWCPALPGCVVHAQSRTGVVERIRDAMAGYVARMEVALPRELGRTLGPGELAQSA